ncbi:MAG: hypothetical protein ABMA25_02330 [Ilumatobacteraceae bacterium]
MKDAGFAEAQWTDCTIDGKVISRRLTEVALKVHPPPCRGTLVLTGHWKAPHDIQVMLMLYDGARRQKIARLCWNPNHQGDLHWHWYARPDGTDTRESVSHPPGTIDHETMTWEVSVGRLQIANIQQPLRS